MQSENRYRVRSRNIQFKIMLLNSWLA